MFPAKTRVRARGVWIRFKCQQENGCDWAKIWTRLTSLLALVMVLIAMTEHCTEAVWKRMGYFSSWFQRDFSSPQQGKQGVHIHAGDAMQQGDISATNQEAESLNRNHSSYDIQSPTPKDPTIVTQAGDKHLKILQRRFHFWNIQLYFLGPFNLYCAPDLPSLWLEYSAPL